MKMPKNVQDRQIQKSKEVWTGVAPPATQCLKCVYCYPDLIINKDNKIVGAYNAHCEIYQPPEDKPNGILEDKIECDFFEERD